MNKKFFLSLALFVGLFMSTNNVEAAPLLSNPYVIPTDVNGVLGKELPLNLVDLSYLGENLIEDIFLNDQLVGVLNFNVKKDDKIIIKNMGKYNQEMLDVNITVLEDSSVTFFQNGILQIKTESLSKGTISMNMYKHDTKIIFPDLYVRFSDKICGAGDKYRQGDLYGYENLYGLYVSKNSGIFLGSADVTQHDGLLDIRYGKGESSNPETVYPIFDNTETGFVRGGTGTSKTLTMFGSFPQPSPPRLSRVAPALYDESTALYTEITPIDIRSFDIRYIVTQKLVEYKDYSNYPTDKSFKIKTNFSLDPIGDSPVEAVVKIENSNQQVDKSYYSGVPLKNSYEITFTTRFLEYYKGKTVVIEYKQRVDSQKVNLMQHYNKYVYSFLFSYSSENRWERDDQYFQQKDPSRNTAAVRYSVYVNAKIGSEQKVIQNKSTDDYDPLDFISNLTSTFPGDSVSAAFTKKVIFQDTGEQNVYITLKGSLSSVTKDIVVKVVAIKGTLHFTDVPSELNFPVVGLTGKMIDYEVASFKDGKLAVVDERPTRSPWSLTARLTENKTSNNFGDILYFRNQEGAVYNITNRTQVVMKNRNLESANTIIDYEQNKKIGLFIRINPLFVKRGAYEGSITWSLVDAPN